MVRLVLTLTFQNYLRSKKVLVIMKKMNAISWCVQLNKETMQTSEQA